MGGLYPHPFLCSQPIFSFRPGRKLAHLRRILELQLLLQCGERPNLHAYYQIPPLRHTSSPYYPPLYVHNLERSLGEAGLGVGQMSLNSLWPIMLLSATSTGWCYYMYPQLALVCITILG